MTRVKICGLTDPAQALACAELGVWAVGLVLWPESPRFCQPEAAEEIGQRLKRRVALVGVFVDQTLDEIAWAADRFGLTHVQLHGHEGPAFCSEVARRTGCKVIKAVQVRDAAQVRSLRPYRVDYHLLDAYVPGAPGGSGHTFNWELARLHDGAVPVILAGGLTPDNVGQAIATVRPFAVDVSSGVERAPGDKDLARVRAFVRAVAAADAPAQAADRAGDTPRNTGTPTPRSAAGAVRATTRGAARARRSRAAARGDRRGGDGVAQAVGRARGRAGRRARRGS
ncbi:phosphoribosylanthranilate isomerase [Thermoleophilum album]|uniref:N-(5'-phosphoribosyl)anthranilate isomerase n=1 Tax=Thermoleophilum album TaxID=29539 RepID=A0A1H6FUA9_THEAL|nr:phosphoribosylanthranilate isomerase [Thermoleophilum album]SEH14002.1 phosphoribosylanthranilate isomerase [Thermoleophilum album]